jgi:uncharacterized membrane protein
MPSAGRILAYGIVASALGGLVLWSLLEMADADESLWRLAKIGIGMGLATVGGGLVYLLLSPTRRDRRG